jgi:transcriptional regulator with XRE-family HTH domain
LTQISASRKLTGVTYQSLRDARKARDLTLVKLAEIVGTDAANISRIERGMQTPSKELARKLFEHFDGTVELGVIYDPEHKAEGNGVHVTE